MTRYTASKENQRALVLFGKIGLEWMGLMSSQSWFEALESYRYCCESANRIGFLIDRLLKFSFQKPNVH
jgi:hypothetical protein